jgi:parallel beta-helix repeat protein
MSCNNILSNTADSKGGGIYYASQVISSTFRDNIIQSNVAEYGGGIYTIIIVNTLSLVT